MSYLGELQGLKWDPISRRYFAINSTSVNQMGSTAPTDRGTSVEVQAVPVDPRVLRTLHRRSGSGECGICGENITGRNISLPCGHKFHTLCATEWFKRKGSCPQCRAPVDAALAAAAAAAR